ADRLHIEIEGVGGHAAKPHCGIDTILVGSQIVSQLQSVVARNVDPLDAAVVSITMFEAGNTDNVIPQTAPLRGAARSLSPSARALLETRIREIVEGAARLYGAKATLVYHRDYPVTRNHAAPTDLAAEVAAEVAGPDRVDADTRPMMGAEDFSFMLDERPGA